MLNTLLVRSAIKATGQGTVIFISHKSWHHLLNFCFRIAVASSQPPVVQPSITMSHPFSFVSVYPRQASVETQLCETHLGSMVSSYAKSSPYSVMRTCLPMKYKRTPSKVMIRKVDAYCISDSSHIRHNGASCE